MQSYTIVVLTQKRCGNNAPTYTHTSRISHSEKKLLHDVVDVRGYFVHSHGCIIKLLYFIISCYVTYTKAKFKFKFLYARSF